MSGSTSARGPDKGDLYAYALAAQATGLCVVPPKQNGSKMPIGKAYIDENGAEQYGWKPWQSEPSTSDEIRQWYERERKTGIGFVCGAVSDNLELFEFDCRLTYERFKSTAEALERGELIVRIEDGYRSDTPGGGVHWLTRCDTIAGNTKLACRPKRPEEQKDANDKIQVLIETRGEGGYTVEAPSNGKVHPTGGVYRLISGGVDTITRITEEERCFLHELAQTFDEMPESAPHADAEPRYRFDGGIQLEPARDALRQGVIEDFNTRATWDEVVCPHGWKFTKRVGQVDYLRRPGKDRNHSATINFGGSDRFCVFSSSTEFKVTDPGGKSKAAYDKFGAYAVLNHHGDQKAAYRDLSDRGYGANENSPTVGGMDGDDWEFTPARKNGHAGTDGNYRVHSASDTASGESDHDQEESGDTAFSAFSRGGFPTECLPGVTRRYVEKAREVTGAPKGYIALPLLTYAGIALGNEHRIEVGEYKERPVLFGGVIGEPGSAKSPANRIAQHPLKVLQTEAHERYTEEMVAFEHNLAAWESLPKKEQATISKPVKPLMGHFFTGNATMEAITSIVRDNRGLVVAPDELVAIITSMDAYRSGRGSDRQSYLSLWDGAPLKVDRKGQEPIFVPHPVVGVVGGIQTSVLKDLAKDGRGDGFVDRFLWVADAAPPPDWTDDVIGDTLKAEMVALFRRLRASTAEHPVMLDEEARSRWRRWFNSNQRTVATSTGLIRGIYAKLPRQLLRIALIIHALTYPDAPADVAVSDETMANAIEITEYFRESANRVVQAFGAEKGTASGGLPDRIHRLLVTTGDWVSRSAIRDHFGRNVSSDDIGTALAVLEAEGLADMRRRTPKSGKGRPSEEWRAITDVPGREKREKRENPSAPPGSPPADEARDKDAESYAVNADQAESDRPAASSVWRCTHCRALERDGDRCGGCGRAAS